MKTSAATARTLNALRFEVYEETGGQLVGASLMSSLPIWGSYNRTSLPVHRGLRGTDVVLRSTGGQPLSAFMSVGSRSRDWAAVELLVDVVELVLLARWGVGEEYLVNVGLGHWATTFVGHQIQFSQKGRDHLEAQHIGNSQKEGLTKGILAKIQSRFYELVYGLS